MCYHPMCNWFSTQQVMNIHSHFNLNLSISCANLITMLAYNCQYEINKIKGLHLCVLICLESNNIHIHSHICNKRTNVEYVLGLRDMSFFFFFFGTKKYREILKTI